MPIMHFHNGALVAAFFVASGCIAAPTGLAKVPQRRNVGGIDTDNNRLIQKGMVALSHFCRSLLQNANRSKCNKARRLCGLRVGDKREVDHIKPVSKGGTNHRSIFGVVSRATNRKKGAKF